MGETRNTLIAASAVLVIASAAQATQLARWSMDPVSAGPFNGGLLVLDSKTGAGEGTILGPGSGNAADDHLWSFNGLPGGGDAATMFSGDTAPANLYANGNSGGASSYNAQSLANVDGGLFFPQDQYGQEFNLPGGFAVEMMYRSNGDQSGAGNMQMMLQGEGDLGFALIANEAGAGSMRFAIQDSSGQFGVVDLVGDNHSDGQWRYLRASYDPGNNAFSMFIVAADGTVDAATNALPGGWSGLRTVGGNMFIGRNTFPFGADPRTFLGLIDEIQITSGALAESDALGVPAPGAAGLAGLALAAAARRRR